MLASLNGSHIRSPGKLNQNRQDPMIPGSLKTFNGFSILPYLSLEREANILTWEYPCACVCILMFHMPVTEIGFFYLFLF
jgi:hypothetical protein